MELYNAASAEQNTRSREDAAKNNIVLTVGTNSLSLLN